MTLPSSQATQLPGGDGPPRRRDGLATTSMVLGILAILTSSLAILSFLFGTPWGLPQIILGVPAVIFGGIAIVRARRDRVSNKGMAIVGLITGIVAAALASSLLVVNIQLTNECQDEMGAELAQREVDYGVNLARDALATCIENKQMG